MRLGLGVVCAESPPETFERGLFRELAVQAGNLTQMPLKMICQKRLTGFKTRHKWSFCDFKQVL